MIKELRVYGDCNIMMGCGCRLTIDYRYAEENIRHGDITESYAEILEFTPCDEHQDIGRDQIDAAKIIMDLAEYHNLAIVNILDGIDTRRHKESLNSYILEGR